MKIPGLVILHHPHWRGAFVVREHLFKQFIEKNHETWDKHDLDPDLFITEEVWLKDKEIEQILLDGVPELFL